MVSRPQSPSSGDPRPRSVSARRQVPSQCPQTSKLSPGSLGAHRVRWASLVASALVAAFGAHSETPSLELGCLCGLKQQRPRCAPGWVPQGKVLSLGPERGAPLIGTAGRGGIKEGGGRKGPAVVFVLLPQACCWLRACRGGDAASGGLLVVFMDQTPGEQRRQLALGVALRAVWLHLRNYLFPKSPGPVRRCHFGYLEKPPGLATLENIFETSCLRWMYKG